MFTYPENLTDSKLEMNQVISNLQELGYIVNTTRQPINQYHIDKISISKQAKPIHRLILSSGLHGIEGFIGHVCQMYFLKNILSKLSDETEVILYHILNPYGMDHFRRFNANNVDLNRNYSNTDFNLDNVEFTKVQSFLSPRKMKTVFGSNIWFYTTVFKNILKHSVKTMNIAILKGQKENQNSIYYSGIQYEPSTRYLLDELDFIYSGIESVLWIDIHSGYGKKHQMSIFNSRYEIEGTKELKNNITYKDIVDSDNDSMYDTDGDITEKLYKNHSDNLHTSSLLALCFEFGTMGSGLLHTVNTFKTVLFDNNSHHIDSNNRFKDYSNKLMRKAFLPNNIKWKTNAISKFEDATIQLLQYKKLIK